MSEFGYTNSRELREFSLEKMQAAMKEMEKIKSHHDMNQAECNMDMLTQRCGKCGHVPEISGGIASGRVVVCIHQLNWLRNELPKAPPRVSTGFGSLPIWDGLEIVLKEESC